MRPPAHHHVREPTTDRQQREEPDRQGGQLGSRQNHPARRGGQRNRRDRAYRDVARSPSTREPTGDRPTSGWRRGRRGRRRRRGSRRRRDGRRGRYGRRRGGLGRRGGGRQGG